MTIENDLRQSRDQAIPEAEVHFLKGQAYLKRAEALMAEGSIGDSVVGERLAILATAHFAAATADRTAIVAGFIRDIANNTRH